MTATPAERLEPEPHGTDGPPGKRVLLIDSEPRIAEFVTVGLAPDGHEVVVAEDGDVGLFLATTERFDLVVVDLVVPGVSGVEIIRRIRSSRPDLPVIVHSGPDDPSVRRACRRAGASAFVAKPLVVESFRATVNEHLARATSREVSH